MGRGRAKAKQTKVARRLKYSTPDMDLESLQRELAGKAPHSTYEDSQDETDYEDPYAEYAYWDEEEKDR
ncbi:MULTISPECIES: DUF3073 domain-containing protein [unclassified Corynebacterium]|uniref:DUF3073 domain-containing protein n=1 Tax=unclassified Corynebacterium TaxID=2624378 RepID=UPI0029C9B312|nr:MULTISPECIES: DUF3073 domain-containing protein [unclassified Corynebacterium]WPF67310.1 DUF3073 domain-containing protein [Corynebacterium sp. 22KM0430]WPF69801.1 DUF3073 domain-containing protein [Corynebacterium sp. 21KM1197]